MNNTVLLRPNSAHTYSKSLEKLRACEPPIWLMIMANYYKSNILVDAEANNYNIEETIEQVIQHKPNKVIILGTGSHPSANIQLKPTVTKLNLLLSKLGIEVESYTTLPIDPCKWGPPRWDLVNINKYTSHNWHSFSNNFNRTPYGVIFTSLGCPMNCTFCQIKSFYGSTFQQRTLEDVAYDFKTLVELNIKNIKIMDELFVFNPNRVKLICDDIINNGYDLNIWAYARIDIMNEEILKKMKRAGINWLCYGIESGNEKIRKEVSKGNFNNNKIKEVIKMTKDNGINCLGNYMFGFWEDNYNTLQETLDFALELNCEFANFYCVSAFPGSPLYDEMIAKGIKLPTDYNEYAQLSNSFNPLPTKYLGSEEVLKFRDSAFEKYYLNNNYTSNIINKFGVEVLTEINKMMDIKIERNETSTSR